MGGDPTSDKRFDQKLKSLDRPVKWDVPMSEGKVLHTH